jgi:hypothetical protein
MSGFVSGTQEVINNLMREASKIIDEVAHAIELTTNDIATHAKSGHEDNSAHMNKRYQNQTSNLTNSIQQGQLAILQKEITQDVIAGQDYAANVELGTSKSRPYPFMFPALMACKKKFEARLNAIKR